MGRPTIYAAEIIDYVCQELAKGIPLTVICRGGAEHEKFAVPMDGDLPRPKVMPADRTVREWEEERPDVGAAIARAREIGEYALAESCLVIARTPQEGVTEKYERRMVDNPDDPEGEKVEEFVLTERKVEDMLGHRKLLIDTQLKLLAKFNPKRWGDRIEHAGHVTLESLVSASNRPEAEPAK